MTTKSEYLQLRVTPEQKQRLRALAKRAGTDISSIVLARALPTGAERFEQLLRLMRRAEERRFALAELSDRLRTSTAASFQRDFAEAPGIGLLDLLTQNQVAAMVEHSAHVLRTETPAWVRDVPPHPVPWFAGDLISLRPYLLRVSPVAFRRRNLFVDTTIGGRA